MTWNVTKTQKKPEIRPLPAKKQRSKFVRFIRTYIITDFLIWMALFLAASVFIYSVFYILRNV